MHGFLSHLHSLMVTMSQKSFVPQALNLSQALMSDTHLSDRRRDVIFPHTEKRPRWNKRSRLLLRGVIRSTGLSRLYPSAYESLPILTNDTWARPEKPSARAPAVVISITLPRAKGPLSVIVTTTLRPFA